MPGIEPHSRHRRCRGPAVRIRWNAARSPRVKSVICTIVMTLPCSSSSDWCISRFIVHLLRLMLCIAWSRHVLHTRCWYSAAADGGIELIWACSSTHRCPTANISLQEHLTHQLHTPIRRRDLLLCQHCAHLCMHHVIQL